jgi:hypothetical protein
MIFLDLFACLIRDVNFCPRAVGPIGESRILRTENPIGGWILAEAVWILRILASLIDGQVKGRAIAALRGWSSREQRLPARASAASICAGGMFFAG